MLTAKWYHHCFILSTVYIITYSDWSKAFAVIYGSKAIENCGLVSREAILLGLSIISVPSTISREVYVERACAEE